MEQEPVDVLLSRPATPQQSAWLDTTCVPLRSIAFAPPAVKALGRSTAPELAAVTLTVSQHMLDASTRTLEVADCSSNVIVTPTRSCVGMAPLPHVLLTAALSWVAPLPACNADTHGTSAHISLRIHGAQEARNLFVARVPRHVTTLARFSSLRSLSLRGAESLSADEVRTRPCERQASTLCWDGGSTSTRTAFT